MWRQIAAFVATFVLMMATAYFLGIAVTAHDAFEFGIADSFLAASAAFFACIGGFISRKYGFALCVGAFYFGLWCLALHYLNVHTGMGFFTVLFINALNVAVSLIASVAGACIGVAVRKTKPASD